MSEKVGSGVNRDIFHQKVFVLSDCVNFDYSEFSHLIIESEAKDSREHLTTRFFLESPERKYSVWDSYGYLMSVSIVMLGGGGGPVENFGNVVDPSVLQQFAELLSGGLFVL
jgi:hypothetical protein